MTVIKRASINRQRRMLKRRVVDTVISHTMEMAKVALEFAALLLLLLSFVAAYICLS